MTTLAVWLFTTSLNLAGRLGYPSFDPIGVRSAPQQYAWPVRFLA